MLAQKLPNDILLRHADWNGKEQWQRAFGKRVGSIELWRLAGKAVKENPVAFGPATEGTALVPELSRLGNGDPATIIRWFDKKPDRLEALARALGCTAADLWADLGLGEPAAAKRPWHPAWPNVAEADVLVEPSFAAPPSWAQLFEKLAQATTSMNADDKANTQVVVKGKGHRKAATWIVGKYAQDAGKAASEPATINENNSDATATAVVIADSRSRKIEVALAPWGSAQIRGLAEALSVTGAIDVAAVGRLGKWAERCVAEPGLLGPDPWPATLIGLAAAVAKEGPPKSATDVRRRRTAAAWKAAYATEAGTLLASHGEELLARFWGQRMATARDPDWRTMSLPDAETVAAAAMPMPSIQEAAALVRVLEAAKSSPPSQAKALAALKTSLTLGEPAGFVERLVAAGLLVRRHDNVEAADSTDALLWAARSGATPSAQVLFGSGAIELAKEWAWSGLSEAQVAGALSATDSYLLIERARCMLAYAIAARPSVAWVREHVAAAWHDLAYAGLFGIGSWVRVAPDETTRQMPAVDLDLLQSASIEFGHLLAPIDPVDPLKCLERGRTPAFATLASQWQAAVARAGGRVHATTIGYFDGEDDEGPIDDCQMLSTLAVVAPGQLAPWLLAEPHRGLVSKRMTSFGNCNLLLRLLEIHLKRNIVEAKAFAAGRQLTVTSERGQVRLSPGPTVQAWFSLPWQLRLRELAAAGGEDADDHFRLMFVLDQRGSVNQQDKHSALTDAELQCVVQILRRCDDKAVDQVLRPHVELDFRSDFHWELTTSNAVSIAQALGRVDLLKLAATAGRQWLAWHDPVIAAGKLQWAQRPQLFHAAQDSLRRWCGDSRGYLGWQAADDWAHKAADALLALGDASEMRRRFQEGPDWLACRDKLDTASRMAKLCRVHAWGQLGPEEMLRCPSAEAAKWLSLSGDPERQHNDDLGYLHVRNRDTLYFAAAAQSAMSVAVFVARHDFGTDVPRWCRALAREDNGPPPVEALKAAYACLATWAELTSWPAGPFGEYLSSLEPEIQGHTEIHRHHFLFWTSEESLALVDGLPEAAQAIGRVRKSALASLLAARDPLPLEIWIRSVESAGGDDLAVAEAGLFQTIDERLESDPLLADLAYAMAQEAGAARSKLVQITARRHKLAWLPAELAKLSDDTLAELTNWVSNADWLPMASLRLAQAATDPRVRLGWLAKARGHVHIDQQFTIELRRWFFEELQPFSGHADAFGHWRRDGLPHAGFVDLLKAAKSALASTESQVLKKRIPQLLRIAAGFDDRGVAETDLGNRLGREQAVEILLTWADELNLPQVRLDFETACADAEATDHHARYPISFHKFTAAWLQRMLVRFADHRPESLSEPLRELLTERARWRGIGWAVDDVLAATEAVLDHGDPPRCERDRAANDTWAIVECGTLPDRFVAKARIALNGPHRAQWAAAFGATIVEQLLPAEVLAAFTSSEFTTL